MAGRKIAVIVGSLRKGSFTRMVAKAMMGLAPAGMSLEFVEIGDLAHYDQDLETDTPPAAWTAFRRITPWQAAPASRPEEPPGQIAYRFMKENSTAAFYPAAGALAVPASAQPDTPWLRGGR
jgi:hypothetical protein